MNKELIKEYLSTLDDTLEKILVLRLYDNYRRYQYSLSESEKTSDNTITILDIKAVSDSLLRLSEEKLKSDEIDNKMKDKIYYYKTLLSSYLIGLELDSKNMIAKILNVIVSLECLLNIGVSFPFCIESCLSERIMGPSKAALKKTR